MQRTGTACDVIDDAGERRDLLRGRPVGRRTWGQVNSTLYSDRAAVERAVELGARLTTPPAADRTRVSPDDVVRRDSLQP